MLAKRIIPTVLTRGRSLVKGVAFNSWRSIGVTSQAVRIHSMRGVDELILLDIGATQENRRPDLRLIEELSQTCFMPLTVGGGVKGLDDAKALLRAGADKIAVRTGGLPVIKEISDSLGNQAVVASIDVHHGYALVGNPKLPSVYEVVDYAKQCELAGAGEILLTTMTREGTLSGYDLETLRNVCEAVNVPVIAHGGCGSYQDMLDAINAGADGVAAGAMFQFTDCTPKGAAKFLYEHGIEVRI